jgi:hypothetical protein
VPTAPAVHQGYLIGRSEDFGTSPFSGQLTDKSISSGGAGGKEQ